jgi:CelD/BcsL family acetyltransferase involved in cellulose biosynthesis
MFQGEIGDMGGTAQPIAGHRDTASAPPRPAAARPQALAPLAGIPAAAWRALQRRAVEPNGYWLADWGFAVNAHASGRTDVDALSAWRAPEGAAAAELIGLLPVIPFRRAYLWPLPALVSADPYGTLTTPLLDRDGADAAAAMLLQQARDTGARALLLRDVSLDGAAMQAMRAALAAQGLAPRVLQFHQRACLDATRDGDAVLRDALGAKKLKELRRQRHRLAEQGEVIFAVARAPAEIDAALEVFLALEAGGWKGKRGTALADDAGDAAFIRAACRGLAAQGQCEIVTLRAGAVPVAAGILVRHLDRAFFFKLGVNERFARTSPGVQLTLDVTRHLCADPSIASADSTAAPGHPMYRRDPTAAAVRVALAARHAVRAPLRHALQAWRARKAKAA